MQNWRRLLYFILLNVLISALTTWAVVTFVLRTYAPPAAPPDPTLIPKSEDQAGNLLVTQPSSQENITDLEQLLVVPGDLEIESIIGAGELATERLLIRHVGEEEISLIGWQLQDQDGNVFNFPAITMFSKGAVTVYSAKGTSTVVELYWGMDEAIWEVGEKAYLIDPAGEVRAEYQVP